MAPGPILGPALASALRRIGAVLQRPVGISDRALNIVAVAIVVLGFAALAGSGCRQPAFGPTRARVQPVQFESGDAVVGRAELLPPGPCSRSPHSYDVARFR